MSYSPRTILVGAAVSFALTTLARAADTGSLGIGQVASPSQIAGWDIDVRADGQGLPPGHGSVREGEKIFAETCAACHGAKGEGKPADRLVGLRHTRNVKTRANRRQLLALRQHFV